MLSEEDWEKRKRNLRQVQRKRKRGGTSCKLSGRVNVSERGFSWPWGYLLCPRNATGLCGIFLREWWGTGPRKGKWGGIGPRWSEYYQRAGWMRERRRNIKELLSGDAVGVRNVEWKVPVVDEGPWKGLKIVLIASSEWRRSASFTRELPVFFFRWSNVVPRGQLKGQPVVFFFVIWLFEWEFPTYVTADQTIRFFKFSCR